MAPQDIRSYVDSLKNAIPYWYLTYYPNDGASLNNDEKICLDRLNRIGIGYFRPLVTVICIKAGPFPLEKRLQALEAIERFIFILLESEGTVQTTKAVSITAWQKSCIIARRE